MYQYFYNIRDRGSELHNFVQLGYSKTLLSLTFDRVSVPMSANLLKP